MNDNKKGKVIHLFASNTHEDRPQRDVPVITRNSGGLNIIITGDLTGTIHIITTTDRAATPRRAL